MFYFFQLIKESERETIIFVFCFDFVMHFFTVTSFSPSVACGIEHVYIMYIDGLGVGGCAMECIRMLHLPFGV